MDLSQIGRIEKRDKPLIRLKILFDSQPKETQSSQHFMIFIFRICSNWKFLLMKTVHWALKRKRSGRSLYFALEIRIANDSGLQYPELFGRSTRIELLWLKFPWSSTFLARTRRNSNRFWRRSFMGSDRFYLHSGSSTESDEKRLPPRSTCFLYFDYCSPEVIYLRFHFKRILYL